MACVWARSKGGTSGRLTLPDALGLEFSRAGWQPDWIIALDAKEPCRGTTQSRQPTAAPAQMRMRFVPRPASAAGASTRRPGSRKDERSSLVVSHEATWWLAHNDAAGVNRRRCGHAEQATAVSAQTLDVPCLLSNCSTRRIVVCMSRALSIVLRLARCGGWPCRLVDTALSSTVPSRSVETACTAASVRCAPWGARCFSAGGGGDGGGGSQGSGVAATSGSSTSSSSTDSELRHQESWKEASQLAAEATRITEAGNLEAAMQLLRTGWQHPSAFAALHPLLWTHVHCCPGTHAARTTRSLPRRAAQAGGAVRPAGHVRRLLAQPAGPLVLLQRRLPGRRAGCQGRAASLGEAAVRAAGGAGPCEGSLLQFCCRTLSVQNWKRSTD